MHRTLGVALSVALLTITLGACSGDSPEDAAEQAASPATNVTTMPAPPTTAAPTTTTVAPTTTTTMADPDNLILLTANVAGASEPIKVEVLAGEFKLVSGMTAREGSSFAVHETWMELTPGLCMDIGPGGLDLFGERYEAGTRLVVRSSGNLEVLGSAAVPASEEAISVAETSESPEFCSLYQEIIDTVVPEFATAEEEDAWRQNHQLEYEELVTLAPADIKDEVQAVADWYADFVALLRASDWDFGALMDDPEASAAMDLLLQEGNLPFEAVDAYVADHCGGAPPPPAAAAPDSDLPSFSEAIAEHWPGEPLCETKAGLSGGPEVFMFGPFGEEASQMSIRQGYAMGFCPGSRYIVTGELTVADGSDYPIGTLLTLDADLNFVAVSSWD